eukprot:TRINITY_DN64911_c0_g1_i1.p1 TRINITY_DN64911_c0_g1~~TRINITY_DN64911_c0_g1_i1.p1  ORF type:complete len:478 (+),score=92.87 TRINITY_DN64911_c0_g1_i1:96-1529(+)
MPRRLSEDDDLDEIEDAEAPTLQTFFGELRVGAKKWRQLRAELGLADDRLATLCAAWASDAGRVRAALDRLLPSEAIAAAVISCLEVNAAVVEPNGRANAEAEDDDEALASSSPSTPPAQSQDGMRDANEEAVVAWTTSYESLPLLPPAGMRGSEGEQQRRHAFQVYLQRVLTKDAATALRALGMDLQKAGSLGACTFLNGAWALLKTLPDREQVLADLVATQKDFDLQPGLRVALLAGPQADRSEGQGQRRRWGRHSGTGASSCELLSRVPEPSLLLCCCFCASPQELSTIAVASRATRALAESDVPWRVACSASRIHVPAYVLSCSSHIRKAFLRYVASCCCECGTPTEFEHVLVGCRLCERCEKSYPRYALVRASHAMEEFQLSQAWMRCLPHLDGATGRVYLRSSVVRLAAIVHQPEELQRLRSTRSQGESASGRQRKALRQERGSGGGRRAIDYSDPCCFEATALHRASHAD